MDSASYVALSRLTAQQRALDVTATNIANADTPGFQAGRVLFSDWLNRQRGTDAPPGGRVVAYTQDRATYRDRQAGALQHTGNPLDLALSGEGYFTVETKAGTRLTRAGRFSPLADGTLADAEGNTVLGADGQRLRRSAASPWCRRPTPTACTPRAAGCCAPRGPPPPWPRPRWSRARWRAATCSRWWKPPG